MPETSIPLSFRVRDRLNVLKRKHHLHSYTELLEKLVGIEEEKKNAIYRHHSGDTYECLQCKAEMKYKQIRCSNCGKLYDWSAPEA